MPHDPATFWETSYSVTRILSESENVSTALTAVLKLLATRFDWDSAGLWRVDYEQVLLRYSEFWSLASGCCDQFASISRLRTFSIGEGLPGRVWASRRAAWITDLSLDDNFPRASVAREYGLATGAAFPIVHGRRVLGVMEFFSRRKRAADQPLMDFLTAVGSQVGLFLDRMRVEKELTGADDQFRLLAGHAVDGIITIDEQSKILFANDAAGRIFGYDPSEMRDLSLTLLMPDYLRHIHERGLRRYLETGKKHISWDGVELPGLHKDGSEIPLEVAFGEFVRDGKKLFSGYVRRKGQAAATAASRRG